MAYDLPIEEMRTIAQENVTAWTPSEPNAVRVRLLDDGSRNITGERIGRTENRTDIAVAVFRVTEKMRADRPGIFGDYEYTAVFNDQLLELEDLVEWNGIVLEVKSIGKPELENASVFYRAMLRIRHGEP